MSEQPQGYAESTITSRVGILKVLTKRGAQLNDPESVKEAIAEQDWVVKRKINAVDAYNLFLTTQGKTWDPPRYRAVHQPVFLPKESELDELIAGTGTKTSAFLLLLKETGARSGEIQRLRWKDIDFEAKLVRITPEKGSWARELPASNRLLDRLAYIRKINTVENPERVFAKQLKTIRRVYEKQRDTIARKTQNDRLRKIRFHTFRHRHATWLYYKTKDIVYVQQRLGHKSITNTLKYIHLSQVYFREENEEYVVKVAKTPEEAMPLLAAGFEEASDFDGVKLYRIPKSRLGG